MTVYKVLHDNDSLGNMVLKFFKSHFKTQVMLERDQTAIDAEGPANYFKVAIYKSS